MMGRRIICDWRVFILFFALPYSDFAFFGLAAGFSAASDLLFLAAAFGSLLVLFASFFTASAFGLFAFFSAGSALFFFAFACPALSSFPDWKRLLIACTVLSVVRTTLASMRSLTFKLLTCRTLVPSMLRAERSMT